MTNEQFAQLLREAREHRGKKQAEAAKGIGMSGAALSSLERRGNLAGISLSDLVHICDYYGWSLEEVVALEFELKPAEDAFPPELTLLFRSLPPERKEFLVRCLETLLRGLV